MSNKQYSTFAKNLQDLHGLQKLTTGMIGNIAMRVNGMSTMKEIKDFLMNKYKLLETTTRIRKHKRSGSVMKPAPLSIDASNKENNENVEKIEYRPALRRRYTGN